MVTTAFLPFPATFLPVLARAYMAPLFWPIKQQHTMKALITSALFIAGSILNTGLAQAQRALADDALAQRINREISTELGLEAGGTLRLTGRILERNEAVAGTGAALVMYTPARVQLSMEFALVEEATNNPIWTGTVFATGRNTMNEALEMLMERGMSRVSAALPVPGQNGQLNVVAREH